MAFLENAHFIVMIVCAILGLGAPYVQAYFAWKAARVKERKEEEIAETISNLRVTFLVFSSLYYMLMFSSRVIFKPTSGRWATCWGSTRSSNKNGSSTMPALGH